MKRGEAARAFLGEAREAAKPMVRPDATATEVAEARMIALWAVVSAAAAKREGGE